MEMVVIQNPVVYPFAGSPVVVNLLVFIRAPRDGDKGGYPIPASCRRIGHKQKENIFLYMDRNPPCHRQKGSAISGNVFV